MATEIKTWLADIKQAIDEINLFLNDTSDFSAFNKDIKTRRAIERDIEIIGEAIGRILLVEPEIEISNARKIVDTRNRIIHGYDSVSYDIIWAIVIQDIPLLLEEVKNLLTL
jgi:uncharacterized protein with HEPN domain